MQTRNALIGVLALLSPLPAIASSCNHEIVVPIRFPAGKTEWVYRGAGTHYFGTFQKGQGLSIAAAGGTNYDTSGDLSWAARSNDPWQLTIEGPGGFTSFSQDGTLYVDRLPATGKYIISIGPCADWGEPGTMLIHASDPRLTIE
jgi:hypothetical protein